MAPEVLPIAHRGASGIVPENTKLAFIKALDLGARCIEFDVQLTADDVPVVIHDETLDRTTNGRGAVAETEFDTISKLDAGSWFGASFANVEVPTLDEALAAIGTRAQINVELKPDERVESLVKHAITSVARAEMFETVIFSSFNADAIKMVRRHVPAARVGVLCPQGRLGPSMAFAEYIAAETLNPHVSLVDSDLVTTAHEKGWKVWAWTANEPGEIALLAALGVDGIFSDYPDRVVALGVDRPCPAT